MKKSIIMLLLCFSNALFADLINIPDDFSTIQSGINAAQDGDTLLVQHGTYYENIDFKGKRIVVTSLFMNSNDPEDIKQTIINGDRRGTVVTIDKGEGALSVLNGFTITNGSSWNGGGIFCSQTTPVLKNLLIQNNEAQNFGGGIELYQSNASISNVTITENIAHYSGGGLNCNSSDPYLENVTISRNESFKSGGGISFRDCKPVFSNNNRCNVYLNTALTGSDLYIELEAPTISVVLDTFTVINPTSFFVEPINNFNFDVLNSKILQINSDLYVSPSGDNNNSGLTPELPLQTIGFALAKINADSSNSHIIHLANGTFSSAATGEHFPLNMVSYVSLYGETRDGVVIDADYQSNVLTFNEVSGSTIKNLTVTGGFLNRESLFLPNGGGIYCNGSNPVLENIVIHNNYASGRGGGIFLDNSNATLINTIIKDNIGGFGGGVCLNRSQIIINNCLIKGNRAERYGGGIYIMEAGGPGINTDVVLENTTITNNSALMSGGGIFLSPDDLSAVTFDSVKRCNIYLNHAGSGADLSAIFEPDESPPATVFVDTFSVLTPTGFFASPVEAFNFNIRNAKIEQVNSDLYVNPTGDNNNSGLSPDKPLKNISYALSKIISDSQNPKTIHLANGAYSPSVNNEVFPLSMINYVSLSGESQEGVILDGDGLTNIMVFDQDSVISIENITITGGNAEGGGGIYSDNSNFNLMNVTFKNNKVTGNGGGIYIFNSTANLNNIIAFDNLAERSGGGVFYWNSNVSLKNSLIYNNVANENGAGIATWGYSEPFFSNVTIYGNHAFNRGGGLYASFATPIFDSQNRCNIYRNTAPVGNDISVEQTSVSVVLDTFTVLNPGEYYATPLDNLTFDILHSVIQPVESNLYVSPTGSNSNSGLSIDQPLKTISNALDLISADSLSSKTIFIGSGIYSPSTNGELFPLGMRDYVSLSGESTDAVILNAGDKSRVLTIFNNTGVIIENLTITGGFYHDGAVLCQNSNPLLKNLIITNNTATSGSGGINFISSKPELINVELSGNTSTNGFGGAISFHDSDAHLTKVAILNNSAKWNGGAIYCNNSSPILINVTISENKAGNRGGGLFCIRSNPFLINTILWNNWPDEVYFEDDPNSNIVTYSNVRGGTYGFTNNHDYVNWSEGNILEAPLFVNPDSGNFNLQESSPLINNGIAFLVWEGDTIVNLPEDSYIGSAPDIGAFESSVISSVKSKPKIPYTFSLKQNYPNPFNPETTIEYQIAESEKVKIEIFDILGRKVKVLVDGYRTRGEHKEVFHADDYPSGIYFYRILAGKFSDVKKMALIK